MAGQHHHAHLAACLLENQIDGPALGITWDGTGYGPDGTVWGGEFLLRDARSYRRVATLVPFRLPGSSRAIEQTWRTALALLWEAYGGAIPRSLPLFDVVPSLDVELALQMLRRGVNTLVTTSVGRLFDGVSALLGVSYENTHQARSPQLLEYAAWRHGPASLALPLPVQTGDPARLDWRPLIVQLIAGLQTGAFPEALLARLAQVGVPACMHSQLPPTDGSLAAGQLWVAASGEQGSRISSS